MDLHLEARSSISRSNTPRGSQYHTKPHPIHRLPTELLSVVFTFACEGERLDVCLFKESAPPTLFALLRVCKDWRDLAFQTKGVWGTFVFLKQHLGMRRNRGGCGAKEATSVMEGIVKLYGKNLSHLFLGWDYVGGDTRRLFDLAFQNQHQLVNLVLYDARCIFDYLNTFDMPMLEELFLWCRIPSNRRLPFVKFNAPKLRRVFLHLPEACEDITPNSLSLPWSQITHLSFGARIGGVDRWVPAGNFFSFLTQLPRLTYLHITGVVLPKKGTNHAMSSLTLPHLKSLELFDHSLTFLLKSPFLAHIATPSLYTFDVCFSIASSPRGGWGEDLREALVPFFQRTPSLRQIRVVVFSGHQALWGQSRHDQHMLQLTGDGPFFARLSQATRVERRHNNFARFAKTRKISTRGWIDGEVWTDRLVDRYINGFPITSLPSDPFVRQEASGGPGHSTERGAGITAQGEEDGRSEGEGGGASASEIHADLGLDVDDEGTERFVDMFFRAQDQVHLEAIKATVFPLLGDSRIPDHIERHVYIFLGSL